MDHAEQAPASRIYYKYPEEVAIVDATRNLCTRLGLTGLDRADITWYDLGQYRPDLPEFLLRGWRSSSQKELAVRSELRGKIAPEDWVPLLAPSLIYNTRLRRRVLSVAAVWLGLSSLIVVSLVWLIFARIVPEYPWTYRYLGPSAIYALTFAVPFALVPLIIVPFGKRLWLQADKIVANELGLGAHLLRILKMINESTPASRERRFLFPMPTLLGRIQSLSDQLNVSAP